MIRLLTLLLLWSVSTSTLAVWLSICDGTVKPAAMPSHVQALAIGGSSRLLWMSENELSEVPCIKQQLPLSIDDILWYSRIAPEEMLRLPTSHSVLLQGNVHDRIFSGEVIPLPEPPPLPGMTSFWPLLLNLKEKIVISPFGQEERAFLEKDETGLVFLCHAGQKPAGFVLHLEMGKLPPLAGLELHVDLQDRGGPFVWSASMLSNPNRDPLPLSTFSVEDGWRTKIMPLAVMIESVAAWDSFTIVCPLKEARLRIKDMHIATSIVHPVARLKRATWIWQVDVWRNATPALWKQLLDLNANLLYVTVPVNKDLAVVADSSALQTFVRAATERGITVWAVAGDPQAVLVSERPTWIRRAKAYAEYNRSVDPKSRLGGVQYDIEPYLVPGYSESPEIWKQAYLDTLSELRQASPLPLEVVVPFWWTKEMVAGRFLLDDLASRVDSLTVMDYRTDSWEIQEQAIPFLIWGKRYGKAVRIALEIGPIVEETRFRFRRADQGELWAVSMGDLPIFIRINHARHNPFGTTFRLEQEITVTGVATSFHDHRDALFTQLPILEQALSAWPNFSGVALHEALNQGSE